MNQNRKDRARDNWGLQGGRPQRRTTSKAPLTEAADGPGKRADERVASIPVDEILPDRYQGRLRWPIELEQIERLYRGEWDGQDFLDFVDQHRRTEENPALDAAWSSIVALARSILSEGQVAPITIAPRHDLPVGYRYVIETGEGRYWAYQMMRWLLRHDPAALALDSSEWREDPAFIRAILISDLSRLRQVAENEQRQSYDSAVDRAIAYASMIAERMGYAVEGSPPGLREGHLELPDAYRRAAQRGLRRLRGEVESLPISTRQIQRHLNLLNELDPWVLGYAKQHGLSEAQLRPLKAKSPDMQRHMALRIVEEGLSSRAIEAAQAREDEEPFAAEEEELPEARGLDESRAAQPLTAPEAVARLLRSLTTAARRYEALRKTLSDEQIEQLMELELASYEQGKSARSRTPRRRVYRLRAFLNRLAE